MIFICYIFIYIGSLWSCMCTEATFSSMLWNCYLKIQSGLCHVYFAFELLSHAPPANLCGIFPDTMIFARPLKYAALHFLPQQRFEFAQPRNFKSFRQDLSPAVPVSILSLLLRCGMIPHSLFGLKSHYSICVICWMCSTLPPPLKPLHFRM